MSKTVLKYNYSQAQNGYIVSGYESIADSGEVIIPDRVAGEEGNLKVFGIGNRAFEGCKEITSIIIPDGVTSIGVGAFFNCFYLTSVTIPASVTSIGEGAFSNCIELTAVYISDLAAWCNIDFAVTDNGGSYPYSNPLYCANNLYLNGTLVTNLVIPDGVTEIKDYAFYYGRSLTLVMIPDSVTSIGRCAFFSCKSLTSVTIPDSVTSIGNAAFVGSTSLAIYCEMASKPSGWNSYWHNSDRTVVWGYTTRGIVNDNVIWIEHGNQIEIIGYQGQPRIITLPEKINGQPIAGVNGFAQCKADLINIHCDAAVIASNAFKDSDNITFRYFTPINRTTDNYPYGANTSTRVYMGMPYQDMDFLGFTFNGKHSYLDLGVLRTINDRVQHSLSPDMNDITADNPGGEGMYYFGSRHKSRKFSIDFAFDHLTEQQMREWKRFCSNKELSDLIFDEEPYKVYTAKITGAPILKTIPFEEDGQRIYKGEGTLEFTCYWPYAHTPDENTKVSEKFIVGGKFGADGKIITNYIDFLHINKPLWEGASGITNIYEKTDEDEYDYVYNAGDIDAPFVAILSLETQQVDKDWEIKIGPLTIIPRETVKGLQWDSKTGIVSGIPIGETTRRAILYDGDGLGGLVPGVNRKPKNVTIKYHYWYY